MPRDEIALEGQRPRGRMSDFDVLREKLEVLSGGRNQFRHRAAVRIEDLAGIYSGMAKVQSKVVADAGGAPTQAQFNALVAQHNLLVQDVTRLYRQLQTVTNTLTKKLHTP